MRVLNNVVVDELFAIHVYIYVTECEMIFAKKGYSPFSDKERKTHISMYVANIAGEIDWSEIFKFIAFFQAKHVIISERISQ